MTDNNDDNDKFRTPSNSRATRTIAKRSRHKSSGAVVLELPGCSEPRIVQYDSKLEHRVLNLYTAMPDTWDIWEQPHPIVYRDRAGNVRRHYFDFLVTLTSGRRLALAVKPLKRVLRSGFLQELHCIRQHMTKEFADDVVLVTDKDFTRAEASFVLMISSPERKTM